MRLKHRWAQNLSYFQNSVETKYNHNSLKKKLGLESINDQWCAEKGKNIPGIIFGRTLELLKESFEAIKINQGLSEEKVIQFKQKVTETLLKTLHELKPLNNDHSENTKYSTWRVKGHKKIVSKDVYASNQEIASLGFNESLSNFVRNKILNAVSRTFLSVKRNTYLVKSEILFQSIDRLNIQNKDYVILSFGIDPLNYSSKYKTPSLSKSKYKGVDIIIVNSFDFRVIQQSLFILKKSDLPRFHFSYHSKDEIAKYDLESLHNVEEIYASIIDLNNNQELRDEISKGNKFDNLRKHVLATIGFLFEIRWKNDIDMVELKLFDKYNSRGIPNELKEIRSI